MHASLDHELYQYDHHKIQNRHFQAREVLEHHWLLEHYLIHQQMLERSLFIRKKEKKRKRRISNTMKGNHDTMDGIQEPTQVCKGLPFQKHQYFNGQVCKLFFRFSLSPVSLS